MSYKRSRRSSAGAPTGRFGKAGPPAQPTAEDLRARAEENTRIAAENSRRAREQQQQQIQQQQQMFANYSAPLGRTDSSSSVNSLAGNPLPYGSNFQFPQSGFRRSGGKRGSTKRRRPSSKKHMKKGKSRRHRK
jgi:hypothetical protein